MKNTDVAGTIHRTYTSYFYMSLTSHYCDVIQLNVILQLDVRIFLFFLLFFYFHT